MILTAQTGYMRNIRGVDLRMRKRWISKLMSWNNVWAQH